MGQSSSTQRERPDIGYSEHLAPFSADRNLDTRNEDMNNGQTTEDSGGVGSSFSDQINSIPGQDTTSDQQTEAPDTWQQPTRLSGGYLPHMRSIEEENTLEVDPTHREYRSAAIARMVARRQSTMSRLGSRILPNSVIRGLLSSQEETPAEGHAHRHGMVSRTIPRTEAAHSSGRFSPFGSLSSRGITRRRTTRGPYFIPRAESSGVSDPSANPSYLDLAAERDPEPTRASWRRSARLHRMRHSISSPISHMFGQSLADMDPHQLGDASNLPTVPAFDEGFPRAMDTSSDFTEPPHELDSVEPEIQHGEHLSPTSPGQTNAGIPGMRRIPALLRARSSRVLRREEQTPLSRVLQLAAAAIAAQLSGTTGPVLPNIQSLGNDGLDGSLENFINSLQNATSAQAQPTATGEGPSNSENEGPSQPVNFLRVFRFANSEPSGQSTPGRSNASGSQEQGTQTDAMDLDGPSEGGEGRTVTLVVVGVRSVPTSNGGNAEQQGTPVGPGLDALLGGLPFLSPNAVPRPPDLTQRADGLPRLQAPRQSVVRCWASRCLPPFIPTALSESPPGPIPPPSTPADQGLSAVSSGTSTPSRRPSSASAMYPDALPILNEDQSLQPTVEPADDAIPPPSTAHRRRRIDSEFARHRALGSGAVRRNGMVEPDQPSPSSGRSWLIYVVGTNLSENHPALTTPSLFTDNPTYEDMILLSSLLGPAKPPVATQADVNSAGGLYRLVEYGGSLVAELVDGAGAIQLQDGERCLICLSDYEVAEEVRELAKCKHIYHKDCIDQWLTTGRNSCPLCRGQGVHETSTSSNNPAPDSASPDVPIV
ncbi:hypothetical protein N7474_010960 [Penicillium riverlandense]|uniref:uncharacterized protein n=1 Tax=Penicillium riverlandense TaxID=1903569 RepID=UPI0025470E5E|nr:uncharacterized protein N7474_010960 [Penicillium riverlandense]KAJ5805073.1 hypothetical protein N7474_010960 [Penicillium riverlandense]